ncbi:MAG: MarR family winged helix-turn-helix transcriptional regulator [Fimbriimonas sp.]
MTYPELDASTTYQLWRATNRWQRMVRRVLEPLGLTHVQFTVLGATRFLAERHPYVTQAMISRTADLDEMMVSQVVRTLEGQGLLARTPHPDDARARCIQLTEEGQAQAVAAKAVVTQEMEAFLAPIGEDRPILTALLRTLAAAGGDPIPEQSA